MNPKDASRILDTVAADFIPDHANLLPKIVAQYQPKTFMQTLRTRPLSTVLLILLALAIFTSAAYAVGKLPGFIPGFGFASDTSTTKVLNAPVEVSHDNLTIQVVRAVNDEDRFWIELVLSQSPHPETFYNAAIILSDGQIFSSQQAGWHESASGEVPILFEFPTLPVDTTTFTLQFNYYLDSQEAGESIEIPLALRALQSGEVIPVQSGNNETWQSETHDGVTLTLENVALASDKTVLQVSLQFDQPNTWLNSDWHAVLTDANGGIYPLTDITPDVSDGVTKLYETLPFSGGEELTLSLAAFPDPENLPMLVDFANSTSFRFDPGTNPEVGQHWILDQILQVGKYNLHLIGATLASTNSIVFEFEPVENVTGVMLYSDQASGVSNGLPVNDHNFTAGLTFDKLPIDAFDIQITGVYYTAHGKWQVDWLVPSAPNGIIVGPTNTPPPTPFTVVTSTPDSSNPLLQEVQALTQKFDQQFQTGPGWVHVIMETVSILSAERIFPPAYILSEQWLEIDADGYVVKSVYQARDEYGNIIQQAATIDNYSVNFTFGDAGYNDGRRYRFSTDMLTQELSQLSNYPTAVVTREESTCDDGLPCLLITVLDTFSAPITNPGGTQSFGGVGRRTWINLLTGLQIQTQAFWLFEDESEQVDYTERYLLVEKISTPPQEILDILAKVVIP